MATKSSKPKSVAKKTTTSATHVTKLSTVKAVSATKKSTLFSSPLKTAPFVGALVAEFIGTFLLAGAVIAGQGQPIIVMFAIAGVVLLVGTLSGSHLNPAITFGAWLTKKVSALRAVGYVVAQVLGAWFAYAVLNAFVHGAAPLSSAAQAYGQTAPTLFQAAVLPVGKEWYIFFAELLGAIILALVMATAFRYKKDRVASALTVGFGIFVALLLAASAAAYVGGTAIVNPALAVSLGAIKWSVWPIAAYIVAPVVGASVGFILHDILRVESDGGND